MALALRRSCGWEDPSLLPPTSSSDDILVFESSGDDALGVLGAGSVTAVLPTAAARALLDLKRAAVRHLPLQSIKSLLGYGHFGRRVWFYHYIRPYVEQATRDIWDGDETAVRAGICELGEVERELRGLRRALPALVGGTAVSQIAAAGTLEEHRALLDRWCGRRWRAAIALAAPRVARAADAERQGAAEAFTSRLAWRPLAENPFVAHALLGAAASATLLETQAIAPRSWLSPAGLARAKSQIDSLELQVASRAGVLARTTRQWSVVILGRAQLAPDELAALPRILASGGRALGWGPPPPGASLVTGDRGLFPGLPWIIGR